MLGGFPGFGGGGMHGHHQPMMPGVHHHPVMMKQNPGGFFYDLVGPRETHVPLVIEKHVDDQGLQLVIGLLILLACGLIIAPVLEETVFRLSLSWIGRLWNAVFSSRRPTAAIDAKETLCFGHRPWVLISSLLFAASHLNNHIPTSSGVDKLLTHGSEHCLQQMGFGMTQFLVTFFLSLRVFSPIYEKRGLVAAMGAHFMWNACAFGIHYQIFIRLVLMGWPNSNTTATVSGGGTSSYATPAKSRLFRDLDFEVLDELVLKETVDPRGSRIGVDDYNPDGIQYDGDTEPVEQPSSNKPKKAPAGASKIDYYIKTVSGYKAAGGT
jgi:membrane protease YdiL (CAAX protease family)